MPMKNELAEDIGLAAGKSQYDAQCKRVLANKEILAWILKHTVKEFADMSIRRIKKCIGNDIQISKVRGGIRERRILQSRNGSSENQKKIRCPEKGNRLTEMLNVLLSTEMKAEQKIRELEEEFHIPMTEKMGKELSQMCNLSDYVEEKGVQKYLTQLIRKKAEKGKSVSEIAEALEESEETVRRIIENIKQVN